MVRGWYEGDAEGSCPSCAHSPSWQREAGRREGVERAGYAHRREGGGAFIARAKSVTWMSSTMSCACTRSAMPSPGTNFDIAPSIYVTSTVACTGTDLYRHQRCVCVCGCVDVWMGVWDVGCGMWYVGGWVSRTPGIEMSMRDICGEGTTACAATSECGECVRERAHQHKKMGGDGGGEALSRVSRLPH